MSSCWIWAGSWPAPAGCGRETRCWTWRPARATPPSPGAQPPPLWGREDHVRALLGDRVTGVTARRQALPVEAFTTPEAFRDYFKAHYGPVIAAYRSLTGDPGRVRALDDALAGLG